MVRNTNEETLARAATFLNRATLYLFICNKEINISFFLSCLENAPVFSPENGVSLAVSVYCNGPGTVLHSPELLL